jgi:hypothetical protein
MRGTLEQSGLHSHRVNKAIRRHRRGKPA